MTRAAGQRHAPAGMPPAAAEARSHVPGVVIFGLVGLALAVWLFLAGIGYDPSGHWSSPRLDLLVFTVPVLSSALALIIVGRDQTGRRHR